MLKKKNKNRITVDDFLQFRPKRLDFEWFISEENLVRIKVPKFKNTITGKLGKSFCKFIQKENMFTANLDKLGSLVWEHCDGRNTVKQILEILKKEFPKEEAIDQRLFLFLQQMESLSYIDYC